MKSKLRILSVLLTLSMLVSLFPAATAAESPVTPTPPSWVKVEDYAIFEGSKAYELKTWEGILRLRADAEVGNYSPSFMQGTQEYNDWSALAKLKDTDTGALFEYGLLKYRYDYNAGVNASLISANDEYSFNKCAGQAEKNSREAVIAKLWYYRGQLGTVQAPSLDSFLKENDITLAHLWDCELIGVQTAALQQDFLDALAKKGRDTSGLKIHEPSPKAATYELVGTPVAPTPPNWCPAEEYAVFDGSVAYLPGNWGKLQVVRNYLQEGHRYQGEIWDAEAYAAYRYLSELRKQVRQDSGLDFEWGLLQAKFYANRGEWVPDWTGGIYVKTYFELASRAKNISPKNAYACEIWMARGNTLPNAPQWELMENLGKLMEDPNFTIAKYMSAEMFGCMAADRRQQLKDMVFVCLDGVVVHPGYYQGKEWQTCKAIGGRTMVPVRNVAELLGADVTWNGDTQQVVMVRGGVSIVMTMDSKEAMVNGEPVTMDVAPAAIDGRTYIPARYMAEFFGQKVDWVGAKQAVVITEDKSVVGNSNLEAWALPMGAMLMNNNDMDATLFGGVTRTGNRNSGRSFLNTSSWGIMSRSDLISSVLSMTDAGHNASFLNDVAYIKGLTASQYNQYLSSTGMDSYMFPYTKQLGEKWGSKGIIAWDLFRMSNLVQWGYTAGYLTYPEALALLEPAAESLRANFKSWDEAYENYLDGYNWWARNDTKGKDVWETDRGKAYLYMKGSAEISAIFDDNLFKTDVVSVPNITAADLAAELK